VVSTLSLINNGSLSPIQRDLPLVTNQNGMQCEKYCVLRQCATSRLPARNSSHNSVNRSTPYLFQPLNLVMAHIAKLGALTDELVTLLTSTSAKVKHLFSLSSPRLPSRADGVGYLSRMKIQIGQHEVIHPIRLRVSDLLHGLLIWGSLEQIDIYYSLCDIHL
jgi:hypothetical protein